MLGVDWAVLVRLRSISSWAGRAVSGHCIREWSVIEVIDQADNLDCEAGP